MTGLSVKENSNPKHHGVLLLPSERSGSVDNSMKSPTQAIKQTRLIIKENKTHLVTYLQCSSTEENQEQENLYQAEWIQGMKAHSERLTRPRFSP